MWKQGLRLRLRLAFLKPPLRIISTVNYLDFDKYKSDAQIHLIYKYIVLKIMLFSSLLYDFFEKYNQTTDFFDKSKYCFDNSTCLLSLQEQVEAGTFHSLWTFLVCLFVFVDKFCAGDRANQMQQWDISAYHYLLMSDIAIIWEIQIYDEIYLVLKSKNIWPNWFFWRNRDYYRLFTALSLWINMVCQICYRTLRLLVILIEMNAIVITAMSMI